jgi:hypothetical protein
MKFSLLAITLLGASTLVYGGLIPHHKKVGAASFLDNGDKQLGGTQKESFTVTLHHGLKNLLQSPSTSSYAKDGIQGGKNDDSNGDDGSHKPPSIK